MRNQISRWFRLAKKVTHWDIYRQGLDFSLRNILDTSNASMGLNFYVCNDLNLFKHRSGISND